MEEVNKKYNGELLHLFHDLDTRLNLVENNLKIFLKNHESEAKDFRLQLTKEMAEQKEEAKANQAYLHTRIHDILGGIATIKVRIAKLPCDYRVEATKTRKEYVDKQISAIWGVMLICVGGLFKIAWEVIFNRR